MSAPELVAQIEEVVNEINKEVPETIIFKVNGDVVIHGEQIHFIKEGCLLEYLEARLEGFQILLEAIQNLETTDLGEFAKKLIKINLRLTQYYMTHSEKQFIN